MAAEGAQSATEAASRATATVTDASSSLWDRVSSWASDNKAVVYAIGGITLVVTGAGVIYYTSNSRAKQTGDLEEQKKSKKERRKAKEDARKATQEPVEEKPRTL